MKKLFRKEANLGYKIKKLVEVEFERRNMKIQVTPRLGKWVNFYYPVGGNCYYTLGGKVIKRKLKKKVLNKSISVSTRLSKERTEMMLPMGAPHTLLRF